MVNEEIEPRDDHNYKANDENLVGCDEAQAKGRARLYEGIKWPQIEDEC
jgi:hypothetical protein